MAQSGIVASALAKASGDEVELVAISTEGDHSKASLSSLGGTGVFASALREALLADECDLVVHSLKDLPTAAYPGLRIGAVPKRVDARDALVSRDGVALDALPEGAKVGTGSPRRVAQLRAFRPDLDIHDIRGNVDTRLARVTADLDAVVLAVAGLTRLGRLDAVSEFLSLGRWPSAPGQGALAIEVRDDSSNALTAALATLDHQSSHLAVLAEREVLAQLEAGCAAPIGATAVLDDELLFLSATIYAIDGSSSLTSSHALVVEGSRQERLQLPAELGKRVADELLRLGAAELAPLGVTS